MFYVILFLLTLVWVAFQDTLPGDILHTVVLTIEGKVFNLRELFIFLLIFSMAFTFPKVFREIAVTLVVVWTLAMFEIPETISLSGGIGLMGFSIFAQKPKQKFHYVKKVNGKFIEGFI